MAIPTTPASSGGAFDSGDLSKLLRDADAGRTGTALALPIAPNYPFFLMHWPTNWQVQSLGLDGPTWVPYLSRHVILPGCNLNRTIKRGEPPTAAYDAAVLKNIRKGATYLDVQRHRLADGRKYLQQAPARDPRTGREGIFFLDAWQTPRDAIQGRRLRFQFDRAAYNAWAISLVVAGVISAPVQQVLEEVTRTKQKRLVRVQGHTNLEPAEYKRRVKAAQVTLDLFGGARVPRSATGAPVLPSSPGPVPSADAAEVA